MSAKFQHTYAIGVKGLRLSVFIKKKSLQIKINPSFDWLIYILYNAMSAYFAVIKNCMNSATLTVLWNNVLTNFHNPYPTQ